MNLSKNNWRSTHHAVSASWIKSAMPWQKCMLNWCWSTHLERETDVWDGCWQRWWRYRPVCRCWISVIGMVRSGIAISLQCGLVWTEIIGRCRNYSVRLSRRLCRSSNACWRILCHKSTCSGVTGYSDPFDGRRGCHIAHQCLAALDRIFQVGICFEQWIFHGTIIHETIRNADNFPVNSSLTARWPLIVAFNNAGSY